MRWAYAESQTVRRSVFLNGIMVIRWTIAMSFHRSPSGCAIVCVYMYTRTILRNRCIHKKYAVYNEKRAR